LPSLLLTRLNETDFKQTKISVVNLSIVDLPYQFGNLSKDDLKDILDSEKAKALQQKLSELNEQGIVIVASAGNNGKIKTLSMRNQLSILSLFSPPICIVGAMDENYLKKPATTDYSSNGSWEIRPTITGYHYRDGTSFSAPEVASILVKMNRIPSNLTSQQKILILMMASDPMFGESRMRQGAGLANESRSLWLMYYFSEDHTEDELVQKAAELGITNDLDWLYFLVRENEKLFFKNPEKLWKKLLYK